MAVSISLSVVQNSQSITNNTSNVTVTLNYSWTNGSYNRYSTTKYIKIGGTKYSFNDADINTDATTSGSGVLFTKTLNIAHNADGTKELNVEAYVDTNLNSIGVLTKTTTKTLTTIPRASTISATDAAVEAVSTITISRKSTDFVHTLTYKIGDISGTIISKTSATKVNWTIPATVYKAFTTSLTKSCTITCKTLTSSGATVGTKTTTITASIAETSASAITATDAAVGAYSTMTIDSKSSSFKHTISYFMSLKFMGTIVKDTAATSHKWQIPTSLYDILTEDGGRAIIISCTTYTSGGVKIGESGAVVTVSIDAAQASTVTATAAVIGSNSTLTISRKYSGFTHKLSYTIGTLSGNVTDSNVATSYKWKLPTSIYALIPNATSKSGTITCKTYTSTGILVGTKTCSFTAKTSAATCAPTLNPTVTNYETTANYVGNTTTFIKGYSNANVAFGATAKNSATIKSKKVVCGTKSRTSDGQLQWIKEADVVFTVTDSRGYITTKTVTVNMINYSKPTATFSHTNLTTDGKLTIRLKGSFFNGSFGAVENTLTPQYRYKKDDGTFTSWYTFPNITKSGNTYNASGSFTTLDYQSIYTFETRVSDALYTNISGGSKAITGKPVFDWGKDNFNFNCDVNMPNNKYIFGYTTDGEKKRLIGMTTNNNVVIGGSNYTPNNIHLIANEGGMVTVSDNNYQNSYNVVGACKALANVYTLETEVIIGDNYTSCVADVFLLGNCLRIGMSCTRNAVTEVGNVTNERVMQIKIKHDGKIDGLYRASFVSDVTGGVASFSATVVSVDDTYATINITLCATTVANNAFNGYFIMPASIKLSAY